METVMGGVKGIVLRAESIDWYWFVCFLRFLLYIIQPCLPAAVLCIEEPGNAQSPLPLLSHALNFLFSFGEDGPGIVGHFCNPLESHLIIQIQF